MPSTYSTSLKLELIANGEQSGLWGQTTNNNLKLIEQAISGVSDIFLTDSEYTLSTFNGLPDESRSAVISCTGSLSAPANVIAPSVQKTYIITNNTGANVTIKTSTGNGVVVLNTTSSLVYCDGTDFYTAVNLNNVIGNQTIAGNEVILGNVTVGGNLVATNNISSVNGNLTFTSNNSIVTAGTNTGAYIPPTGTTAQRPTSPNGGMSRFNTDTGTYEIFNGAVWQSITGAYAVNYLIAAGGGGGGGGTNAQAGGGGGGAGGLFANSTSVSPGTAYVITVGSGGSGGAGAATTGGTNGANSTAFSLTAIGGGGGACNSGAGYANGNSGGSGGGGYSYTAGTGLGGSGTAGQGNNGAASPGGDYGGGGGGYGSAGSGATGGTGLTSTITGSSVIYSKGGNGGAGGSATANTGNGGNGGISPGSGGGGNGGAGVVIISYPSTTQRATGGTVTSYTSGSLVYWVHTFTTSGTFTA